MDLLNDFLPLNYFCPDFVRILRFVDSHSIIFGAPISEILMINISMKFETNFIKKDHVIYKIL